jgi:hypothetical protein
MQSIIPRGVLPALPAATEDAHRAVEVDDCVEAEQVEPQQQAPQIVLALLAACAAKDFHHHGLRDGKRAATCRSVRSGV